MAMTKYPFSANSGRKVKWFLLKVIHAISMMA